MTSPRWRSSSSCRPTSRARSRGRSSRRSPGRIKLQRGDRDGGAADLRRCGEIRSALGMTNPAECAWRSQLALATADASLAEAGLAGGERVARPRAIRVALRAPGEIEADLDRLRDAVDVLAGADAPLEHARALVALGGRLRRGGHRGAARAPLRRGLALADHGGAPPRAEHARTELGAPGARPRRRR